MLTQSLSPGALPEQVGSASCAFHAEQVLQTRISLGHNLRLASLPIAFYNQSWKWLWNVYVPELMRFFGVCWMSEGFVAISHAVKTQGSKITLLESSRTLDHGWKFLKGVVAGVNPAQIKLSGRAVILLFITVPILVFKFKPSVFWVDPTATEHEEGWESPFWWQPRSSESSASPESQDQSQECGGIKVLSFWLWCLHLLSFQQWCFNLQNALLGFRCAQLEFLPRHHSAEIAEFACGFQCSNQSVFIGVINFLWEWGWSGAFSM